MCLLSCVKSIIMNIWKRAKGGITMARKALKNEKNISYDEQKKRYYVCFDYGKDESGKRRKQYKTYETKEEAIKARNQFQNDRINGTLIQPSKICSCAVK